MEWAHLWALVGIVLDFVSIFNLYHLYNTTICASPFTNTVIMPLESNMLNNLIMKCVENIPWYSKFHVILTQVWRFLSSSSSGTWFMYIFKFQFLIGTIQTCCHDLLYGEARLFLWSHLKPLSRRAGWETIKQNCIWFVKDMLHKKENSCNTSSLVKD